MMTVGKRSIVHLSASRTEPHARKMRSRWGIASALGLGVVLALAGGVAGPGCGPGGGDGSAAQSENPSETASKATVVSIAYGPHPLQKMDLWMTPSDRPHPVLVRIHGGGWYGGKPTELHGPMKELLARGVAIAVIRYRPTSTHPLPAPVHDAARAVQFLRAHAKEWNLDRRRFAATGPSAGGTIALWLAVHDDLANPDALDPVLRESTRLSAAASRNAPTSIEPEVIERWVGPEPLRDPMIAAAVGEATIEAAQDRQDRYGPIYAEFSPIRHISADDPPVFLRYTDHDVSGTEAIHHPIFGIRFQERSAAIGHESHLRTSDGQTPGSYKRIIDFLADKLGVSERRERMLPGSSTRTGGEVSRREAADGFALEQLEALGYLSRSDQDVRGGAEARVEAGLVVRDPERAASGFVLINPITQPRALLLNRLGVVKHSWEDPTCLNWTRAELQPNGDLLVIGKCEKDLVASRYDKDNVSRYSWGGELLWRKPLRAHHDLDRSAEGELLVLGVALRKVEETRIFDHSLLHLSSEGELIRKYSIFDLLSSSPGIYRLPLESKHPSAVKETGPVDLLHVNSVARMPFPSLEPLGGLYRDSCVLLSVRHQNLVAIVDLEREELVWAWGPGIVQYQHEATWLENGNVLVFDNGTDDRGYSRIVEVDPRTDQITWEYRGDPPERFYSRGRGTAQALKNGNVLIASSNQGEVFEVTREGDVVWRYVVRGENDERLIVRALHYPRRWVVPHLVKKSEASKASH